MLIEVLQRLIGQREPVIVAGLGGEAGGTLVTDAGDHEGEFKAIQVITETVFDAVAGNIEGLVGATIPAGTVIHGLFTSIRIASGSVIIYRS